MPQSPSPYQLIDPQPWAVQQARQHHDEALYRVGEYAIFYLLWQWDDHDAGLVGRCPVCFLPYGRTAEAFQQPAQAQCAACLGTTYEGGFKARIVRPCIVAYTEEQDSDEKHGTYIKSVADVQSTCDFRIRIGDIIVRADGGRWQVTSVDSTRLHSGFQTPIPERVNLAYAMGRAALAEEFSVVYKADPVDPNVVAALLDTSHPHHPREFTDFEIIRGDLIWHTPVGKGPLATPATSHPVSDQSTWGELGQHTWGELTTTQWGNL